MDHYLNTVINRTDVQDSAKLENLHTSFGYI